MTLSKIISRILGGGFTSNELEVLWAVTNIDGQPTMDGYLNHGYDLNTLYNNIRGPEIFSNRTEFDDLIKKYVRENILVYRTTNNSVLLKDKQALDSAKGKLWYKRLNHFLIKIKNKYELEILSAVLGILGTLGGVYLGYRLQASQENSNSTENMLKALAELTKTQATQSSDLAAAINKLANNLSTLEYYKNTKTNPSTDTKKRP